MHEKGHFMTQPVPQPRPGFIADVFNGAVRGDYTPYLGIAGHVTQAVFGFIPIIGTICALRDFFADRRKKDNFGAFLNFLALIPFLGGFPKTALVIRSIRHVGGAVQTSQYVMEITKSHFHGQSGADPTQR